MKNRTKARAIEVFLFGISMGYRTKEKTDLFKGNDKIWHHRTTRNMGTPQKSITNQLTTEHEIRDYENKMCNDVYIKVLIIPMECTQIKSYWTGLRIHL